LTGVVVAGTAMTPFGRHPEAGLVDLAVAAGEAAMADAGVSAEQVDALELGTFLGRSLQRRGVLASVVASRLGLGPVPTTVVEGACASGGIALRHGVLAVRAGAARAVLCVGAEHMTAVPTPAAGAALGEAFDGEARVLGLTFPGFFGLVAAAHRARLGTGRAHLTAVAVKNRAHGATNPDAMFHDPVEADAVEASRPIADPLRLFDCAPIADGAAAAVVLHRDDVPDPARAVPVLACEQASGPAAVASIADLTTFGATRAAAARAYEAAGAEPGDVDVVELHDCFSIAEIVDSEDLGILPRGEAAAAIAAGATRAGGPGGAPVVNPSGGLLSRGHPVGATGLAQVHELVRQLRGEARLQVPGARLGLAHNLGGSGATATVTLLAAS
jgi:acetyl-CoA C-acetyltransferase